MFCDLIPSLGANFETLYSELPTEMLTLPSTIWIDEFIDSWMDGQFDEWLCRVNLGRNGKRPRKHALARIAEEELRQWIFPT